MIYDLSSYPGDTGRKNTGNKTNTKMSNFSTADRIDMGVRSHTIAVLNN